MEYIYATLLLHKAGKEITDANIKKVLEAAHVQADDGRIKALMAALEGVDIEEAMKSAAPVAAPAAAPAAAHAAAAPAHKKEDDKKTEEQAAAGLGSLFG